MIPMLAVIPGPVVVICLLLAAGLVFGALERGQR